MSTVNVFSRVNVSFKAINVFSRVKVSFNVNCLRGNVSCNAMFFKVMVNFNVKSFKSQFQCQSFSRVSFNVDIFQEWMSVSMSMFSSVNNNSNVSLIQYSMSVSMSI